MTDKHSMPVRTKSEEGRVRYLLVESLQEKTALQWLYETCDDPIWEYVFAGTEWQGYQSEGPLMIRAEQGSETYRSALRELKSKRLQGLIIESQQGLVGVLEWARQRLTVSLDGDRAGLLRFYDPVVWHRLAPEPNPSSNGVERVIYWHNLNGEYRWLTSERPEPITMQPVPTLSERQKLALA